MRKSRVGLGFGEENWREGIVGFCGVLWVVGFCGFFGFRRGGGSGGGEREREVVVVDFFCTQGEVVFLIFLVCLALQ